MPKRILIIGMLYSFIGLIASWNIISNLLKLQIYPDLTVLLLPIGLGLIKGQLWAQWWARFTIILGYILCSLFGGMVILSPESVTAGWFDKSFTGTEAAPYIVIFAVVIATILGIMHWFLYSEKAEDYFYFSEVTQNTSENTSLQS